MKVVKKAIYLVLHFLIAFIGVGVLVALGWYALRPFLVAVAPIDLFRREAPLVLPFFPLQSLSAFLLGLSVSRMRNGFAKSSAAHWIWVVPLFWLGLVTLMRHPQSVLESRSYEFRIRLIAVLPFLTSAFYSLGHALGSWVGKPDKELGTTSAEPSC